MDYVFTFDPTAEAGEKLAPEVRAEIEVLAPSTLNDNAVTTPKIVDGAVTHAKLATDAVYSANIAAGEVDTINLAPDAVTADKIADGAVVPAATGVGVVTAQDSGGVATDLHLVPISVLDHAAIVTPDPTAVYLILEED